MQNTNTKTKTKKHRDNKYYELEKAFETRGIYNFPLTLDNSLYFKERYTCESICGKGSFGIVIKAYDIINSIQVAIKVLSLQDHTKIHTRKMHTQ